MQKLTKTNIRSILHFIPDDIIIYIMEFASTYKLKDGIDESKLDIKSLHLNSHHASFSYLYENCRSKIQWMYYANVDDIYTAYACLDNIDSMNERCLQLLSLNRNDVVVDYLLANPSRIVYYEFSCNPNDKAVDHLIENPAKIEWNALSFNKNERATKWLIDNHPDKINYDVLSANFNDTSTNHCINNLNLCKWATVSHNTNDIFIKYLLNNPDKISPSPPNYIEFGANNTPIIFVNLSDLSINWGDLSGENNDLIVDYLIENSQHINWLTFSYNENDKAVKFMLEHHEDKICWDIFSSNKNDIAVQHIIDNIDNTNITRDSFALNRSPKAIEYIFNNSNCRQCTTPHEYISSLNYDIVKHHPKLIDWKIMSKNPTIFELNTNRLYKLLNININADT